MGFERELREAKKNTEREEARQEAERAYEYEEKRREQERERLKSEEARRQLIRKHIGPVKPMVDRLMKELGRATWRSFAFEYYENVDCSPVLVGLLASWSVGRTHIIGGNIWDVGWKPTLDPKHQWTAKELYSIAVWVDQGERLYVESVKEGNELNDANLKRILKEKYLKGPQGNYPSHGDGGVHGFTGG